MRCQARRANSESADSLCTRRNQTLAHSNWLLICAVALQVNVRGEIGEMLGQRKTAVDGGGAGPVTRVLVRQPNRC
jgi:microcompartment protein CcmK/EutM